MLPYKPVHIESLDSMHEQLMDLYTSTVDETITKSYVVNHDSLNRINELHKFLSENNLTVAVARLFVTEPNYSIQIHSDTTKDPKFLALNIPIIGCTNSYMRWWDQVSVVEILHSERYAHNVPIFDGPNKIIAHQLELTSPHLVRIDLPHDAINNNDTVRVVLSLRFNPEPLHLWH